MYYQVLTKYVSWSIWSTSGLQKHSYTEWLFSSWIPYGSGSRSNIPVRPNTLIPRLPDSESIQSSEEAYKARRKRNFDNHHNAKELPQLYESDNAYIRDLNRTGIVTENNPGRSHLISTPLGTVRHNRQKMSALPTDVVKNSVVNSPAPRTAPDSPAGNIHTDDRSPSTCRSNEWQAYAAYEPLSSVHVCTHYTHLY